MKPNEKHEPARRKDTTVRALELAESPPFALCHLNETRKKINILTIIFSLKES